MASPSNGGGTVRWHVIDTCATCTTKITNSKTAFRKNSMDLSSRSEPKVRYKPLSSKDECRLDPFRNKILPGIFIRRVPRAGGGWSGDLLITDCQTTWEICQLPKFTLKCSDTKKSHKKEHCRSHVQTDFSQSSMFLDLTAAKCRHGKSRAR